MPRRPSNKKPLPEDEVQSAYQAVQRLTGGDDKLPPEPTEAELRSRAASILGKLGGRKGGLKRARNLSAEERSRIARKGAKARWKGHKKG